MRVMYTNFEGIRATENGDLIYSAGELVPVDVVNGIKYVSLVTSDRGVVVFPVHEIIATAFLEPIVKKKKHTCITAAFLSNDTMNTSVNNLAIVESPNFITAVNEKTGELIHKFASFGEAEAAGYKKNVLKNKFKTINPRDGIRWTRSPGIIILSDCITDKAIKKIAGMEKQPTPIETITLLPKPDKPKYDAAGYSSIAYCVVEFTGDIKEFTSLKDAANYAIENGATESLNEVEKLIIKSCENEGDIEYAYITGTWQFVK